jgi:hypothetical protein
MNKSKSSSNPGPFSEVNKSNNEVVTDHNSGCEFFNSSNLEKAFHGSVEIEQAPGVMPSAFHEDTLSNRARRFFLNFKHNTKTTICLTMFSIILNLITILGTLVITYIYSKYKICPNAID